MEIYAKIPRFHLLSAARFRAFASFTGCWSYNFPLVLSYANWSKRGDYLSPQLTLLNHELYRLSSPFLTSCLELCCGDEVAPFWVLVRWTNSTFCSIHTWTRYGQLLHAALQIAYSTTVAKNLASHGRASFTTVWPRGSLTHDCPECHPSLTIETKLVASATAAHFLGLCRNFCVFYEYCWHKKSWWHQCFSVDSTQWGWSDLA